MYKINYAKFNKNYIGIKELEFYNEMELITFLKLVETNDNGEIVYLFTEEIDNDNLMQVDCREILITSNFDTVFDNIKAMDYSDTLIHLHEYKSFEDAYAVALDMREGGSLQSINN
jgi:hypothetical protein